MPERLTRAQQQEAAKTRISYFYLFYHTFIVNHHTEDGEETFHFQITQHNFVGSPQF
jgi:hypothetical protein